MNTLTLGNERILSVTAHPDDLEMHHLDLLARARRLCLHRHEWRSEHH